MCLPQAGFMPKDGQKLGTSEEEAIIAARNVELDFLVPSHVWRFSEWVGLERQEWSFSDHAGASWRFQLNVPTFLGIWVLVQIWLLPVGMGRHGEGESGDGELMLSRRWGEEAFH